MAKKVLGWGLLALLIFFVVTNPTGAANTVKAIGGWLATIAAGIGDFFARLVS